MIAPMDAISYRQAARHDAEAIAGLQTENWQAAYRGMLPDAYLDGPVASERLALWRSRLASPGAGRLFVLLAESGEELVGFVCVLLDEEPQWGACLDNLHVLPGWRGRGIGRALFGRAARWVNSVVPGWGMHLWVLEANLDARRFYDALGGEIVERLQKKVVKGAIVASIRYFWPDLQALEVELGCG
jgi:GNAT superfamily N-acetyltransferase